MLAEIRSGDIPAHRVADYSFPKWLERSYVHTGAAAEPGHRFDGSISNVMDACHSPLSLARKSIFVHLQLWLSSRPPRPRIP